MNAGHSVYDQIKTIIAGSKYKLDVPEKFSINNVAFSFYLWFVKRIIWLSLGSLFVNLIIFFFFNYAELINTIHVTSFTILFFFLPLKSIAITFGIILFEILRYFFINPKTKYLS